LLAAPPEALTREDGTRGVLVCPEVALGVKRKIRNAKTAQSNRAQPKLMCESHELVLNFM
jgi:hypothetical protein